MKKLTTTTMILILGLSAGAQIVNVKSAIKSKTEQRVNNNINNTIDKELNETEAVATNPKKKNKKEKKNPSASPVTGTSPAEPVASTDPAGTGSTSTTTTITPTPPVLKVYNNYDFKAGEKIIFEDNFVSDVDGEFPTHWELVYGQGVVNQVDGKAAINIIDGNYARIYPLIKGKKYLSDEFTVEYDMYANGGAPIIMWINGGEQNDRELGVITVAESEAAISGRNQDDGWKELNATYPADLQNEFRNKWHHVAIAFKNMQIKIYVDQYRVCVMPNSGINQQAWLSFGGVGQLENPLVFTNLKIAEGGGMNMLNKMETDGKIVTHGIKFDVNKAVIKPESMGTLNDLVKLMKDKPDLKFEIGGHTDSDGEDAANMKLSQERADAVKVQLISMGIDAGRLTTKGYGETKPLVPNTSAEGKANNRRVEFVKK